LTRPERHGREYIQARIREEIGRATRFGHPFALLIFEEIPAADGIAQRKKMEYGLAALAGVARTCDAIARAFDDTIVVLLVETDARGAKDALMHMRERLARGAGSWQVTVYDFPKHQAEIERLPLLTAA
jgi:hypothetical protein